MATDLNTNPLYNNIATAAQEVKTAYSGLPTFQSNMQASLVGPDAGLNSALGGYTDKVAELFAHDNQIAQNWSTSQVPTNLQPEGFMEDPYAKAMASSELYKQKGDETAKALNLYEKRKNYLGDLVTKAVEIYKAGIEGKKIDYEAAKTQFSNAIDLMNAETSRMNANTSASALAEGKTAKERLRNDNLRQLSDDAKNGATLQDVIDRYAKDLDQSDIVDTYEKNSTHGKKIKESPITVNTMYRAAKAGSNTLDLIGQITNKQVANDIASNALMAADSKAFLQQLGAENPSYVEAITSGNFPLAQKLAAKFGKDSSFYSQLNAYAANVIKQYYGSAFTSTEVNAAKQWVANPTVQNGNQIYASLLANNITASRRIKSGLATVGITDDNYVNSYLNQVGGNYDPKSVLNGGTWQ